MSTLVQLRTEAIARGFNFISASRVTNALNQAHRELCEAHPWPFRRTSATGTSPLTIADLGQVLSVADANSKKLWRTTKDALVAESLILTTTGDPDSYYVDNGVVRTYPVGGTLTVTYLKAPATLVADADAFLQPAAYDNLLVDMAVRRLYIDSDDFDSARALLEEIDRATNQMRRALLQESYDPLYIYPA